MITEKQLKIFEVFALAPFAEFTRKQIKKDLNEKSNNVLALAINLLKRENVLLEKKIGKSGILTLNLDNNLTIDYIALCNNQRIGEIAEKGVKRLIKEIDFITPFYTVVIFGSYAVHKQKKSSDLDIAVFIESEENRKKIEAAIRSAKLKTLLEIDAHVISKAEMIEMLINNEENLGKQIAKKHMAVCNHKIFYSIIKEGMKRGFRI